MIRGAGGGGGGTEVFGTGFVFAETQTDLKIQRILFQSCRYEECILACMDSVVGSMTLVLQPLTLMAHLQDELTIENIK